MKAFQLRETRGTGGLVLREDLDRPEIGPGEVLIRVRATSLNSRLHDCAWPISCCGKA
jgi:NADPH:quinone reductase-like Zn-dependent oxidoreductase